MLDWIDEQTLKLLLANVPQDLEFLRGDLSLDDQTFRRVGELSKTRGDAELQWEALKSIVHLEDSVQTAAVELSTRHEVTVLYSSLSDHTPLATKLPTEKCGLTFHRFGDMVGLRFPSACEMKRVSNGPLQDLFWEAVVQSLKRMQVVSQTCCHLKRFVVFALAPPSCCVFFASSKYETSQMSWTVHMVTINPVHLFPLWKILEDFATPDPSWFLHPQAGSLQKLVKELWSPTTALPVVKRKGRKVANPLEGEGYLPLCYFSVQFVKNSSSGIVYLINGPELVPNDPPQPDRFGKKKTPSTLCGVFRRNENTLAVKVFERKDDFERERLSLTSMADLLSGGAEDLKDVISSSNLKTTFYALATSSGPETLKWFSTVEPEKKRRALPKASKITNMVDAHKKHCEDKQFEMWWGVADRSPRPVLLMEAGVPLEEAIKGLDNEQRESLEVNVGHGVATCLRLLHASKRVHRDIRVPNVVLFHGEAQLIDFGFSAAFHEKTKAPKAAREIMDKHELTRIQTSWHPVHDDVMLQHLMRKLPTLRSEYQF